MECFVSFFLWTFDWLQSFLFLRVSERDILISVRESG